MLFAVRLFFMRALSSVCRVYVLCSSGCSPQVLLLPCVLDHGEGQHHVHAALIPHMTPASLLGLQPWFACVCGESKCVDMHVHVQGGGDGLPERQHTGHPQAAQAAGEGVPAAAACRARRRVCVHLPAAGQRVHCLRRRPRLPTAHHL